MKGITIRDKKAGQLTFDLVDILRTIGDGVIDSQWRVYDAEAIGNSAEYLHTIADNEISISGNELLSIAGDLIQVVDGVFEAFRDAPHPWLIIRAVDSSEFDVECDSAVVHDKLRARFRDLSQIQT